MLEDIFGELGWAHAADAVHFPHPCHSSALPNGCIKNALYYGYSGFCKGFMFIFLFVNLLGRIPINRKKRTLIRLEDMVLFVFLCIKL